MSRVQATLDKWCTQAQQSLPNTTTPNPDSSLNNPDSLLLTEPKLPSLTPSENLSQQTPPLPSPTKGTPTSRTQPTNTKHQRNSQQTSFHPHHDKISLQLHSNNSDWGHPINSNKAAHSNIRVAFRNVRFLPSKLPNARHDQLVQDIRSSQYDIIGMAETNTFWPKVPENARPHQRFKEHFESVHVSYAFNSNHLDNYEIRQPGGTLVLSTGPMISRIMESGHDPTKLGRWSWVRYKGKQCTIRVVCVYRPIISQSLNGVYQQHRNYFHDQGNPCCPREQLLVDLDKQIQKWQHSGDHLIIMGDFKEAINSKKISHFFWSYGLKEAILGHHPSLHPPNTYRHGSTPIDGIFISDHLQTTKAGYSSTDWGLETDHRLLWMDLDTTPIFHPKDIPHWKPAARRLVMKDPRICNRFLSARLLSTKQHSLLEKVQELQNDLSNNRITSDKAKDMFNELDNIRVEGILSADKQCRKLRLGSIPWTPELATCLFRIQYYRNTIRQLQSSTRIQSRYLLSLRQKGNIDKQPESLEEAKTLLTKSFEAFFNYKKSAHNRRHSYLEELAASKATHHNLAYKSALKQLRDRESTRQSFRHIKKWLGKPRIGLSSIETSDEYNNSILVTDKHGMEQACMTENIRRFTQASHTPSLLPDQVQLLGWTATTQTSADILAGKSPTTINDLHPSIARILPLLSRPPNSTTQVSHSLTNADLTYHLKRCNEFTSTGPSGVHYGHLKVSCSHPRLCRIDALFLELSLEHGLLLDRWTSAIDVMIPKKTDSIQVNKLRTIMLFECDWNLLNKIIGKRTMSLAEKNSTIAKEQYGSRKKKSAILHACNKMLLFDVIRDRKINVALIILDALSCYDCVAIPFASLCLLRQGTTASMIKVMFIPLSQMKHFIRTAFGDSTTYYCQSSIPFHGIGQGNGAGPMIWVMVSTPLLDNLRTNKYGINISTNDEPSSLLSAFTFVDDNDMVQQIHSSDNFTKDAQKALDAWNDGLQTSGGSCAPEKSSWSPVIHEWRNDKWILRTTFDETVNISMLNNQGTRVPLTRQSPKDSSKALGIFFSPSGNNDDQFRYLQTKCKTWAQAINRSRLKRNEVFLAMTTTIWKTIEYPLLASTMTLSQCSNLVGIILMAGLPRSGICRYIDRKPLFSCTKFQGFGLKHPYFIQGLRKLEHVFGQNDSTSELILQEAFAAMAITSGLGTNFLSFNLPNILTILDNTWTKSLWEFCNYYKFSLIRHVTPPFRHINDDFLMSNLGTTFKGRLLQQLNSCRLYLRIELLSDLFTIDMNRVQPHLWAGNLLENSNDTRKWPLQPRPGNQSWNTWRNSLQQNFQLDNRGITTTRRKITSFNSTNWTWFYQIQTQRIYEQQGNTFQIWTKQPTRRRTRTLKFALTQSTPITPTNLLPCTIEKTGIHICISSHLPLPLPEFNPSSSINRYDSSIIFSVVGSLNLIKQHLQSSTIIVATDGSYKHPYAAGSWIISSAALYPHHYLQGTVQSPGRAKDQDSHRAEASAILGAMIIINELQFFQHPQEAHYLTVCCDNNSALHYAFDNERHPAITSKVPDFDIFQSIRKIIPYMKHNLRWQHVKGHQDRYYGPLDIWATLNSKADSLANERRIGILGHLPNCQLPYENWSLYSQESKICKTFADTLYEHASVPNMQQFWKKQRNLPIDSFYKVNWTAIESASKEVTSQQQRWISKHATGICGVNEVLHRWKKRSDTLCPRCGANETSQHVWKCKGKHSYELWIIALDTLATWMESVSTDPKIITAIKNNLLSWLNDTPTPAERSFSEFEQDDIGWEFFIEGHLSTSWAETQESYYKSLNKYNSRQRWTVELIKKLWKIAWDIWTYRNGIAEVSNSTQAASKLTEEIRIIIDTPDILKQPSFIYSKKTKQLLANATTGTKRAWITAHSALVAFTQKNKKQRRELTQMQSTMKTFLTPKP